MEKILVLDFGGQYCQLIARRVREANVYAEVRAYDKISLAEIADAGYRGIILTGGPHSVTKEESPHFDKGLLDAGIPVLAICYGHQLMAWLGGGEICTDSACREYGSVTLSVQNSPLFEKVPAKSTCWMSHNDYVSSVPEGFRIIAVSENCPCAAMADDSRMLYGIQFHPEVTHTEYGRQILYNFLYAICRCSGDWLMKDFVRDTIARCRQELQGKKLLCALSGGVDSTVAAVLLHKAVGENLTCVFVDHGLLRKDEGDLVERTLKEQFDLNLIRVNAAGRFLGRLKGVTEPEQKRKIIGEEFIRVFEDEAKKLGHIDALVQGTIYPDVIESGAGKAGVIKSHHNVGGLPERMGFSMIVEPLRMLFKDEVRQAGRELGIPERLVRRQPFPGPGLAIRVLGEVTNEKLEILREADAIFRDEIDRAQPAVPVSQYFAVLTDCRSVGVMGDSRTYGYALVLRAVTTDDFMTADWARLSSDLLSDVSRRITNEVRGINRVVYDITSKPPATVEWE